MKSVSVFPALLRRGLLTRASQPQIYRNSCKSLNLIQNGLNQQQQQQQQQQYRHFVSRSSAAWNSSDKNPTNADSNSTSSSSSSESSTSSSSSSSATIVDLPTLQQKRVYAVQCAVPMVGFGFMDNLIMIQAGDYIDCTLGTTFGFATLTAAAMGQICSDVSGVAFGGIVDGFFARIGVPVSDMTSDQINLSGVRFVRTLSMAIGVFSGCFLGMSSLLFMDLNKRERLKKQENLRTIFETLADEGSGLCNVERCVLYIVDDDERFVWSTGKKVRGKLEKVMEECADEIQRASVKGQVSMRVLADCLKRVGWADSDIAEAVPEATSLDINEAHRLLQNLTRTDENRVELKEGATKHWVVTNKRVLNVKDITKDDRFSNSSMKRSASVVGVEPPRSLLIGPVFEDVGEDNTAGEPRVIGLVEMVNKKNERGMIIPFSRDDEKLLRMLCHHCGTFITQAED